MAYSMIGGFIILLFATVHSLICISTDCPYGQDYCNTRCPRDDMFCHRASSLHVGQFTVVELGCTLSLDSNDANCTDTASHYNHTERMSYYCCDRDRCNGVAGETSHLVTLFDPPVKYPSQPPPITHG